MDRSKHEIQSSVKKHENLHNYLLQRNNVSFKYRKAKYKKL